MAQGSYLAYIAGSYALTGLVLGWLIAASLFAGRAARARLERIEAESREPQP
jgi:heme exporter protein CcmD